MKTLKMKSFKSNLVVIILFFALSITGLCLSLPTLLMLIQGPQDLDTFDYTQITETDFDKAYVSGTIYGIYDYYCDETRDGSLSAREYLIDGGDYYYMGLRVKKADMEPAEALLSASIDYLDGVDDGTALEAAQYTVKGTIKPMDSESIRILKEYLDWYTMDEETRSTVLFYYLEVNSIGDSDLPTMIIFLILAAFFLLLADLFLVWSLTGKYQKEVNDYIQSSPYPDSTRNKIESFLSTTNPEYGLYYNSSYICGQAGSNTFLKDTPKLAWAYQSTTSHKYMYFITVSKSYALTLGFADGTRYSMPVSKEAQVQELIGKLSQLCPQMIPGYSNELDAMFRKNLPAFLDLKYNKVQAEQPAYENTWQE